MQQPAFISLRGNHNDMEQRLPNKPKFPSFDALNFFFTCSADEPVTHGVTFMFRRVVATIAAVPSYDSPRLLFISPIAKPFDY